MCNASKICAGPRLSIVKIKTKDYFKPDFFMADYSSMLELGYQAPDFALPDTVSGQTFSLQSAKGAKGVLVMFICNHCPYVKHVRPELVALGKKYKALGIQIFAISANDAKNYPADAPDKMKAIAQEWGFPFPYLYDESQSVAKAYQAVCTPDFFLFDSNFRCAYRGRLDGSTPGNGLPVTGEDMYAALDCLLNNQPISEDQSPSVGCSIKWKA